MPQITQLVTWSRDLNPGALGSKQSRLFHGPGEVIAARTRGEEWLDSRESLERQSRGCGWWWIRAGPGRVGDPCVSAAGASGQMGVPAHSQEWLEGAHIWGEGPAQLRLAESERPMRQPKGGSWKVGLELRGQARSGGRDLGLGRYLESWSGGGRQG